jgi:hypothetical protein
VREQRRFARVDTRLELPAAATRAKRKAPPSAAELRAFVASVEKEMREGAPKPKKSPPLPKGLTRPQMRPQHTPGGLPVRQAEPVLAAAVKRTVLRRDSVALSRTHHAFGAVR